MILRLGCVSFLNTRPLIFGLETRNDVRLFPEVPARLLDGLRADRYDAALLPVIDYLRLPGLTLVPASGIGSFGHTLTVRLFSRVPFDTITSLACDTDSHTSVILARIILARRFGIRPEIIDLPRADDDPRQAILLIGDKVVCEEPAGYPIQLDLGHEWREITALPFVFATWMARPGTDLDRLYSILDQAKRAGLAHIDAIVRDHAAPLGWPPALARQYLTDYLRFDVGERELDAIRLFHRLAAEEQFIDARDELRLFRL